MLTDGTEADASAMTCEGCGEPLSSHKCGSNGTVEPTVVVSRSGKGTTRKRPEDKPACPHCGAPMHFNYGATAVNATCITTQYALDKGLITDPQHQRCPILTIEMMGEIVEWAKSLATPITYGDMVSAAGGAGTYAALRPKTGRKKKAVAAGAGEKIEDIAAKVTTEIEAPAEKPKRSKKPPKGLQEATAAAVQEAEEIVKPKRKSKATAMPEVGEPLPADGTTVTEAPVESAEDEKERRKRERAERRRQLLGKI